MIQSFEQVANDSPQTRRTNALAIAALCVGGMVLSRSIEDRKLADELRGAAKAAALELAKWSVRSYCGQAESHRPSIFCCESSIGIPAMAALVCTVPV